MVDREVFDVYVVISNLATMRVKVGFRTKIKSILDVLADDFGYEGAKSALVLTEVVPVAFAPDYGCDYKEVVAKARLRLALTEPERFVKLVSDHTMEECAMWTDAIIYVIIDGFDADTDYLDRVISKAGPPDVSLPDRSGPFVSKSRRRGEFAQTRVVHDGLYRTKSDSSECDLGAGERKEGDKGVNFLALLENQHTFNYINATQLKLRREAATAPRHRSFGTGVNYECSCDNAECDAYKKLVVVPVGHTKKSGDRPFENVYLSRSIKCPLCKHAVPAVYGFGFSNCMFEWRGVTGDGARLSYRNVAPPGRFLAYSGADAASASATKSRAPAMTGKATEWATLIITTAAFTPESS